MICEKCLLEPAILSCTRCKCGMYCSQDCQKNDWKTHKSYCKLWNKSGQFKNPFFTHFPIKTPECYDMLYPLDESYINYSRGRHGETFLHQAVIDGDVEKLKDLYERNAYVNALDWRDNNALYYACSHAGKDNILRNEPKLREEIVLFLLDVGCDPFARGGFSGKRPFEAAEHYGYKDIATVITTHKYAPIWRDLGVNFNESTPPEALSTAVKKNMDLFWRSRSSLWLFSPARDNHLEIIPHPKVLENVNPDDIPNSVEALFVDCAQRHKLLMCEFDNLVAS